MNGEPRRLEYANLRCMDTPRIHVEQLHIKQVHAIQSLADADRQIAVHSPAPA
jgi:hypothetical protein